MVSCVVCDERVLVKRGGNFKESMGIVTWNPLPLLQRDGSLLISGGARNIGEAVAAAETQLPYLVCLVQRLAQAGSPLPWMTEQAPPPSARFPLALPLGDINALKGETCLWMRG